MRSFTSALLALLILATPAFAQQPLSPADFRDAAIALIRHADPGAEVELRDDLGVNIRSSRFAERPEYFVNFDNAYREYLADPTQLQVILDRWVRFATQPPENVQMAERVVAIVRPRAVAEQLARESAMIRSENGHAPSPIIWRPFAGDLAAVLVFDGAESVQYALPESLAEVGMSVEQAWAAAPANLPGRLGELQMGGVGGMDRMLYVTGGNGLAPSTLLHGGVCSNGAERFAFLVVDRNGYLAADRADPVALTQFRTVLDELRVSGNSLSLTPLGCQNGQVVEIVLTD